MIFVLPSGVIIPNWMIGVVSVIGREGYYLVLSGTTGLSEEDEKYLIRETGTKGVFYPELN